MAKKKKQLGGYVYPVNYVPQKKNGGWLDEFEDVPQAQFGINSFPTNVIIEKVAGLFGGDKYSRPDEIDIKDLRKIRKTTNKKIDPNSDLVSGKYDTRLIGEMLDQAKEFGISKEDAWNLAAIGLQESGWGKTDSNLGHVIGDISQGDTEHPFINAYLNKMKDADRLKITNPELRLQVYNGLGVVKPETEQNYHGFKMKKIYGVPVPKEGISMKKTPLYGRQIIDIRDNVLKKNPEVVKFVDSYYPEEKQYGGSVESTMGGLTDKGFNYNGAWGGPSMQMGGSMPGSVGFTYARTINPAPSKGKYAKKTMASAQDGEEVEYMELPEITVIGSKDKSTRDFYNNLIDTFSKGRNTNNPFINQQVIGNYLGAMNLGKEYGFPKVKPETKSGIYKNAKGHYNPLTKTIYADTPDTWLSEMAHHVQMKDNIVGKGLQWLGNDLVQYLKKPAIELRNAFKYGANSSPLDYTQEDFNEWVNTSPYEKEGTVEHEAHSVIEPMLKEKIRNARKDYKNTSVSEASKKRFLYETRDLQNGGEMKFYQEGLDWTPKNISRDGSEIPQAQIGIATGDIASLPGVRKEIPLSKEELAKNKKAVEERVKAENAKIVADRKAKIKASEEAKKKPMSAKTLAEQTQATGDKFRLFPNDPNSFIDDYLNPGVMIGHLASGLGKVPLNVQEGNYGQAAWNLAAPAVFGAAETVAAPYIKKAADFARSPLNTIDKNFSTVGRALEDIRLKGEAAGLDPYEIAKQQFKKVGITSNQRQGYTPGVSELLYKYVKPRGYGGNNGQNKLQETLINIKKGGYKEMYPQRKDAWSLYLGMPQKNKTFTISNTSPALHRSYPASKLEGMDIYNIRGFEDKVAPSYADDLSVPIEKYLRPLEKPILFDKDQIIMGGYNKRITKLGTEYNDIWDLEPEFTLTSLVPKKVSENPLLENLFYKKRTINGLEVADPRKIKIPISKFVGKPFMSHGISDNTSYDFVKTLESQIDDYINNFKPDVDKVFNGKERLLKMQQDLEKVKNYVPKRKKGGKIKKDDMGYWNPENWGKPVEIGSNEITMQGVYQPLLGISDTGDVQMMYPGEDYTFDGDTVTEYPVMQKGGRVPIYTENPRDPRLRAYQDSLKLHNLSLKIANRPNGDISYGRKPEGKFNKNFTAADAMEYLYPVTPDEIAMSKLSNKSKILPTRHYPGEAGGVHFKKPVQPVEYRKPQPKKEEPAKKQEQPKPVERKQNVYEGSPVYSGSVGSGMPSALIGFANQRGDTTYIKPEDYERFGVPKYGKEYIESKTTNKKKNGGWLDEFE